MLLILQAWVNIASVTTAGSVIDSTKDNHGNNRSTEQGSERIKVHTKYKNNKTLIIIILIILYYITKSRYNDNRDLINHNTHQIVQTHQYRFKHRKAFYCRM